MKARGLYTPGLQLEAGKPVELRFGYFSYYFESPEEKASLKVKWGNDK